LGITEERWGALITMLVENEYIAGVEVTEYIAYEHPTIVLDNPKITLKGLEYLHENSVMKKIFRAAKGIKDIMPGI
jgi:hypothetical protein